MIPKSLKLFPICIAGMIGGQIANTEAAKFVQDESWADAMNYIVPDVCLDRAGRPLSGISPADGNPNCISHRDLKVGEGIPYFTASLSTPGIGPRFRNATIPYKIPNLRGISPLRIFDMNAEPRGTVPVFGTRGFADGIRNLYVQSENSISIGIAADNSGPVTYNGPICKGNVTDPATRYDSIVLIGRNVFNGAQAGTYSMPGVGKGRSWVPEACTKVVGRVRSYKWRWRYLSFDLGNGRKTPHLKTLITSTMPDDDRSHVEVFYFTRELGFTRWESWDNLRGANWTPEQSANLKDKAQKLEVSKVCTDFSSSSQDSQVGFPLMKVTENASWVTSGCYQSTLILPPTDKDAAFTLAAIDRLKRAPLFAPLFGTVPVAPPSIVEVINVTTGRSAIVKSCKVGNNEPHQCLEFSAAPGDRIQIHGKGFSLANSVVQLNFETLLGPIPSNGTVIDFDMPAKKAGAGLAPGSYKLNVYNDENAASSSPVSGFVITQAK